MSLIKLERPVRPRAVRRVDREHDDDAPLHVGRRCWGWHVRGTADLDDANVVAPLVVVADTDAHVDAGADVDFDDDVDAGLMLMSILKYFFW